MTRWSISTVTRSPVETKFTGFPACWSRARQEPDSSFCLLLFLQSQSGGTILIGVGERLEADATVKTKEGKKEEKMNKTQRSMQVPPFECVHMCAQGLI